jgi:hypothetical protein
MLLGWLSVRAIPAKPDARTRAQVSKTQKRRGRLRVEEWVSAARNGTGAGKISFMTTGCTHYEHMAPLVPMFSADSMFLPKNLLNSPAPEQGALKDLRSSLQSAASETQGGTWFICVIEMCGARGGGSPESNGEILMPSVEPPMLTVVC